MISIVKFNSTVIFSASPIALFQCGGDGNMSSKNDTLMIAKTALKLLETPKLPSAPSMNLWDVLQVPQAEPSIGESSHGLLAEEEEN